MKPKFKRIIVSLLLKNSTPNGIALGASIGVFIGVLPVYGLHTVFVILAAIIVRSANKAAILLGTNVSLPPTVPFITWGGYEIGRVIFRGRFAPLSWSDFKHISFQNICQHYQPLFLGSVILGVICGLAAYFIVFFTVKIIKERRIRGREAKRKNKRV